MPKFETFDDNISSNEAPLSLGRVRDIHGNDWDQREDEVMKKYLYQTSIDPELKLFLRSLLDSREWLQLDAELNKVLRRADNDDTIRINKIKELIDKQV